MNFLKKMFGLEKKVESKPKASTKKAGKKAVKKTAKKATKVVCTYQTDFVESYNKFYKNVLHNYMVENNFPYSIEKKGFTFYSTNLHK